MSKPETYTGHELAAALRHHSDLPVQICLVDEYDRESQRAVAIRLEISLDATGAEVLVITGYLEDGERPG